MSTVPSVWDKVGVMLSGTDAPWTVEGLERLLAQLQARFLARPDAMRLDVDAPWQSIDAAVLERTWRRRKNAAVSLRMPQGSGVELHPNRHGAVSFYVQRARFRELGTEAVLDAAHELARVVPNFRYAFATALGDLPDLWVAQGWPWLPPCFTTVLHWWQALHPARYRDSYSREALLEAPARVRAWEDGTIELRAFDDPFAWNAPGALTAFEDLVRYLDVRRLRPK